MNPLEELKQEHEAIERELIELETIMEFDIINYPNLIHVLKKLCEKWDFHEKKEEKVFPVLMIEQIKIPIEQMTCDHKELKIHRDKIYKAIGSGSEFELKNILEKNGRIIIKQLRDHIEDEEKVLYAIVISNYTVDQLKKAWYEVTYLDQI